MKKLIIMVLMAMLVSATTAFAVSPTVLTNYSTTDIGTPIGSATDGTVGPIEIGSTKFSVSTNVKLVASGDGGGFNVAAKHYAGDIAYLSSSVSAGIEELTGQAKGEDMASTLILSENVDNVYSEAI